MSPEESALKVLAYLVIGIATLVYAAWIFKPTYRIPQFSLLDLLSQLMAYGLVVGFIQVITKDRKYETATQVWIMLSQAALVPLGFYVGCKNRKYINDNFYNIRLLALMLGTLSVLSLIPAFLLGVAFIPPDS